MFTAKADTIDDNLRALEEIAITLLTHNDSLAIEVHRIWVDLKEGIADLRGETIADGCNCDECDCTEVCGWTKPHTVVEGSCSNCGTELLQYGEESMIEFECETHGDVSWSR
jgi:hypothetical protein